MSFNVISLDKWLSFVAAAGIPEMSADPEAPKPPVAYIPATRVGACDVAELVNAMNGVGLPDANTIAPMMASLKQHLAINPRDMVRWECCASAPLKTKMAKGIVGLDERCRQLDVDDPRFLDILVEWQHAGETTLGLYARPWVEAMVVDKYPVEFRAFVSSGRVKGVSSYYPQRPLPPQYNKTAREVWKIVNRLLSHPDCPRGFTADFIVTCDQILFLDGGPPHLARSGSHPCCFPAGQVGGIALQKVA